MNLPKIEVKGKGTRRYYYVNGVKVRARYSKGCRPKLFMPELGIVVKFRHKWECYHHDDLKFYNKIAEEDKKYFPRLIEQTEDYTIHEYVPHKRVKWDSLEHYMAENLSHKYGFDDFDLAQIGKRIDNGELVYFDYGYYGENWGKYGDYDY